MEKSIPKTLKILQLILIIRYDLKVMLCIAGKLKIGCYSVISLHHVFLHIGYCIPNLIIVFDIIGVENVHALCLFTERS